MTNQCTRVFFRLSFVTLHVFAYLVSRMCMYFGDQRHSCTPLDRSSSFDPPAHRVYLGILTLFCTYAQVKFPYHIDKVESNDSMYGGEANYVGELLVFVDKLIEEVLSQLAVIGEKGDITVRGRNQNWITDRVRQGKGRSKVGT